MAFNLPGIATGLTAVLGLVSTALAIHANIQNQVVKNQSDRQALIIEEQEARIRENELALKQKAEARADATADRDYTLKVHDVVLKALSATENSAKHQHIALALVTTLSDATLRGRLSSAFQQSPTVIDPQVVERANEIKQAAVEDIAQQNQLREAVKEQWSYDVFWCSGNPQNESRASKIYAELSAVPNRRVRLRDPWTPEQNRQPGFQAQGLEIRAERQEMRQAEIVKDILDQALKDNFKIRPIRSPTQSYLSIFVCP